MERRPYRRTPGPPFHRRPREAAKVPLPRMAATSMAKGALLTALLKPMEGYGIILAFLNGVLYP